MNAAETAKYLAWLKVTLPVMEAFAKGEEIQHSTPSQRMPLWDDCTTPMWLPAHSYRIKPKPIERWAVVNPKDYVEGTYDSRSHAEQIAKKYDFRVVHMREVMED